MDETTQEDSLDRQVREAAPYIDDEGFTMRVLQCLPAPRLARRRIHAVILLSITVLASALAYFISDGGRFISDGIARLARVPMLWLLFVALASGILVTSVGLVAAISKSRELQS